MKTNRELLELAAKAAGIEGVYTFRAGGKNGSGLACDIEGICRSGGAHWNPLHNDGDAFRLAVKLGISWCRNEELAFANMDADPSDPEQSFAFCEELLNSPTHATRRAIVRAAAEIGSTIDFEQNKSP